MALDSLPRFPEGKSALAPAATGADPVASGRRTTMVLQALFLVCFWAGIYTLHQQSRNITAAFQREETKRKQAEEEAKEYAALEGKWKCTDGHGAVLELRGREFTLTQKASHAREGNYALKDDALELWIRVFSGYAAYWRLHYRLTPGELVVWGDERFRFMVLRRDPRSDEPHPLEVRFKRVSK